MCEKHHRNGADNCDCVQIIAELREHIREAETSIKRAEALKEKAKSTAQLVRSLRYRDHIQKKGAKLLTCTAVGFASLRRCNLFERCSSGVAEGEPVHVLFNRK